MQNLIRLCLRLWAPPKLLLNLLPKLLLLMLFQGLACHAAQAFDLQGHRGARGLAPENSLAGFELAIRQGVSTLELDIAITHDGVLVVHHDLELNPNHTRDAQGRWLEKPTAPIFHMTWNELQTYDIGRIKPGSDYARQFPDQQPADGTRVPRLSDLFARVKALGNTTVRFAIETKVRPDSPQHTLPPEPFAQAVVAEVRKAEMQGRVQIMSFDWRTLQVVQRIAPEIPTVYLTAQQSWTDNIAANSPQGSEWTAGFQFKEHGSVPKMIKAAGGSYWSVFHGDLNAAALREAHELGLKVLVWTVNDVPRMQRFIDLGVDGLITDRPDTAMLVLQGRKITPQ
jgi:glycerophosphoryl diester phosphodiesterase